MWHISDNNDLAGILAPARRNQVCGGGQDIGEKSGCPASARRNQGRYPGDYVQCRGKCQIVRNDQPEFMVDYVCIAAKREYVRKVSRETLCRLTYWIGK